MNLLKFEYKVTSGINEIEINKIAYGALSYISKIKSEANYDNDFAFVHVPTDLEELNKVKDLAQHKKELLPTTLVVIGIGGSNLGTIAVHEAINGILYNETSPELKIYFADTVDSDYISSIFDLVRNELEANRNVIINVISKSGTTTETLVNFDIFADLIKKYKGKDFNKYIVVTTDRDSKLWNYAIETDCDVLEIPKNVGGRYSVFTSVGLFPLAMLNIDIVDLLYGAQLAVENSLSDKIEENNALISASILFKYYQNNIRIHDTFLFSVALESVGKWYRQLIGESIGKKFDNSGNIVHVGISPTVSIGSTDLHSVGQLYLSGPNDRFTSFVVLEKVENNLTIPEGPEIDKINPYIKNKSLKFIMDAIIYGVQRAYENQNLPYCTIRLKDKSAQVIGEFLQFKMFEIVYLGYLFNINPFNQPGVEFYKKETKRILEKGEL